MLHCRGQARPSERHFMSMDRQLPWIAAVVTATFGVAILGLILLARNREVERLRTSLSELQAEAGQLEQALARALEERASLETRLQELEQVRQTEAQERDRLLEEMQSALQSRDVTISELQGRLTVDILDRVLFDLGEAVLREEGRSILRKVADVLTAHPGRRVMIIGHTDNVPIRPAARTRFPSNWELSTARATAAVRFLVDECGLDPRRLAAMGFGEYRPVADNATAEGRARNRRIEIVILPPATDSWFAPPATLYAPEPQGPTIQTNQPAAPAFAQP